MMRTVRSRPSVARRRPLGLKVMERGRPSMLVKVCSRVAAWCRRRSTRRGGTIFDDSVLGGLPQVDCGIGSGEAVARVSGGDEVGADSVVFGKRPWWRAGADRRRRSVWRRLFTTGERRGVGEEVTGPAFVAAGTHLGEGLGGEVPELRRGLRREEVTAVVVHAGSR